MLSLLTLGARWTFVGGKGGVGKTTTAAALAVDIADAGQDVLVLSTDPAHSLGDALGVALGPEPRPVPGVPRLTATELDPERERAAFLQSHGDALRALVERGTYLERADVNGFLDLAVPGMDELAALLRLLELAQAPGPRLIVDTAPTGHTLRLLELPRQARTWLAALQALEDKHRTVAEALAGTYRADDASQFPDRMQAELSRLDALLTDPAATRFILVTNPEPVVRAETLRYLDQLGRLHVAVGGLVVNRSTAGEGTAGESVNAPAAPSAAPSVPLVYLPLLPEEPQGPEGLRRYSAAASAESTAAPAAAPAAAVRLHLGDAYHPPLDRRLYVVGGKGGVGKTTSSAALAALLAESGGRVLLLGTDPAGSVGDVFGIAVGPDAVVVPELPSLTVREVDAAREWDQFREQFRGAVEQLFTEMFGGGISAEADRRVIERLVDLAPPGMDEVMALVEVVDLLQSAAYTALVLDTAPTGHFLRLMEMPGVATDWLHAVLRLLLKYRGATGLGDLAEQVLRLSRAVRALRTLLQDRASLWVAAVALPEALSIPETRRLTEDLDVLGLAPDVLLINRLFARGGEVPPQRAARAAELLRTSGISRAAGAPDCVPPPQGVEPLLALIRAWRTLPLGRACANP